jgi:hypothetical protein
MIDQPASASLPPGFSDWLSAAELMNMSVEDLSKVYHHNPTIVSRVIAGQAILVPIRKNMGDMDNIYTLNETAARVWELMDGQRTLGEVHQQIVAEFNVDPQRAEQDIIGIVDELRKLGTILE